MLERHEVWFLYLKLEVTPKPTTYNNVYAQNVWTAIGTSIPTKCYINQYAIAQSQLT